MSLGGILLTGGSSRRMGFDKAAVLVEGTPCAVRVARALSEVVPRAVEVGPGFSGLPSVREDPPGRGPLPAIWAGAAALGGGAALVVACDLPLVTAEVLAVLARWPGKCSVVPVVGDQPQVLCARWAAADLAAVPSLVAAGERGVRALLGRPGVELVTEAAWPGRLDPRALADVDSPADLDALGLEWSAPDGRDGDS